jgi:hypothetical protein
VYALLVATPIALGAQETNQPDPHQGISNPPSDDTITAPAPEAAPAAQPAPPPYAAETVPNESHSAPANATETIQPPASSDGTDDGIVLVAPSENAPSQVAPPENAPGPSLSQRPAMADPDGDIVHPAPLAPGELGEGAVIRVRLLDRLSTTDTQPGESFHTRVASDVIQDGQVLIPAGSEIDGRVISVSTGHAGGHGSMRLRPETVTLPDGSHFRLYAQLSGAPGSKDRIRNEGLVTPGSRLKKDGIEYGSVVSAGAVTGAILAGPGGALAGTIVGASVVSVHLLVNHPQATLEDGTVLLFTLSEPLNLVPAASSGN